MNSNVFLGMIVEMQWN